VAAYEEIISAVICGDADSIKSEVNKDLSEGSKPGDILEHGLIGGMNIVAERFKSGEMFLPEVIASANAMHCGLDIVKPLLAESDKARTGKIVIGTVAGDIHDIGKRIVAFLLEGNGYEVIDLGVDVPDEEFAKAVSEYKPDVLGMSALLTTTMPKMGSVVKLLQEKSLRDNVKIIVGGASVNEEFAISIGVDAYAVDASSGLEWVKKMISRL
jgi:5-methyltetrahydrofolate--homocysteine methyltransferase